MNDLVNDQIRTGKHEEKIWQVKSFAVIHEVRYFVSMLLIMVLTLEVVTKIYLTGLKSFLGFVPYNPKSRKIYTTRWTTNFYIQL